MPEFLDCSATTVFTEVVLVCNDLWEKWRLMSCVASRMLSGRLIGRPETVRGSRDSSSREAKNDELIWLTFAALIRVMMIGISGKSATNAGSAHEFHSSLGTAWTTPVRKKKSPSIDDLLEYETPNVSRSEFVYFCAGTIKGT